MSCERLAKHYDTTKPDMPCDSETVTEYYKKCCDYSKNKVQLCCDKGYPKELEEKRDAACKAKDAKSCGTLASIAHRQKNYEKSFDYAKRGCDAGKDDTSCKLLAYMYYYGQGVEKDYKKSFNLYEGLCDRDIYDMCAILSHFYTDGVGIKQDIKKGKKILEKLCYDKYKEGCANLAVLYESDQYGMKDEKKATELYTIACKDDPKSPSCDKIGGTSKRLEFFCTEKKRGYSCVELADTYYRNDLEKKLYFYNKACEIGFERACGQIASITEQKEASEKRKSACEEKNDGEACFQIASSYNYDPKNQLYFYEKACEYGYGQGCYEAVKYTNDPEKKLYFFDKGCEYGLAYTCLYASDLVRGDNNKAMEYGYKACKLGDTATCKRIEGIAKKACDEGDQDGCKWLDTIKNRK